MQTKKKEMDNPFFKGDFMKKFIYLICIFLFGNICSYGYDCLENQDFLQLYESRDTSLTGRKENKFYLNPERISISKNGKIYLISDLYGNVPISFLCYDSDGIHTLSFAIYICNKCGASYSSQPSSCPRVIDSKTGEKCGSTSFTVTGLMPD